MGCCKCEEYGWGYRPDKTRTIGEKEYCIFHAPKSHKKIEDFEKELHNYITMFLNFEEDSFCNLRGTIFPFEVQFSKIVNGNILPNIDFEHCVFMENADFSHMSFKGSNFNKTSFYKSVSFFGSKFTDETTFINTKFCTQKVEFETEFSKSFFKDFVHFNNAEFCGLTSFGYTNFKSIANFKEAKFKNTISFENVFSDKGNIRLDGLATHSLGNMWFTCREVPFLSFRTCEKWPPYPHLYKKIKKDSPDMKIFYQLMEDTYRSLKTGAATDNDQFMCSEWHFKEKEMQLKKLLFNDHPHFSDKILQKILKAYKTFSGYGEDPVRAGLWLIIWICCTLLLSIILRDAGSVDSPLKEWTRYMPLTKVPTENLGHSGIRYVCMYASQLVITLQAALFGFALRNRFRR